jgi:hypothetical protein
MAVRFSWSPLPIVWALVCVVGYGAALLSVSWPYVDAYYTLNEASRWTWPQYLSYAFGGGATRDRIALSAGVGYCLLLYVALAAMLEHVRASAWRHTLALGLVGVIGVGWIGRSAEAYFQIRDMAWDYHLEWTARYADVGGPAQPQGPLITSMRSMALSRTPADPGFEPAWTYTLFERRYAPRRAD